LIINANNTFSITPSQAIGDNKKKVKWELRDWKGYSLLGFEFGFFDRKEAFILGENTHINFPSPSRDF
jgi:hypothetical protein